MQSQTIVFQDPVIASLIARLNAQDAFNVQLIARMNAQDQLIENHVRSMDARISRLNAWLCTQNPDKTFKPNTIIT